MATNDPNAYKKGAPDDFATVPGTDSPHVQPYGPEGAPPAVTIVTSTITDAAAKAALNRLIDFLNTEGIAVITKG